MFKNFEEGANIYAMHQCYNYQILQQENIDLIFGLLSFRGRHESWFSLKESKEIEDIESEADSIK